MFYLKLILLFTIGTLAFSFLLSSSTPFRIKQVSYHTRNVAWTWDNTLGSEITVAFGDHHNVAFLAKRYPPCQLFHYDMINRTHGNIYDRVGGHLIYQFASIPPAFFLYKQGFDTRYTLTAHHSYHPRWYLSDVGDSVAVMLTPNTGVLFDVLLNKRNSILHVGKWVDNLTTFPVYENLTYVPI